MDGQSRIEKNADGTPRRRIMEAFKLRELSAVDRPAQQHAKMTLMKRDDSADKAYNPNQPRHPKGNREGGRWSAGGGGGSGSTKPERGRELVISALDAFRDDLRDSEDDEDANYSHFMRSRMAEIDSAMERLEAGGKIGRSEVVREALSFYADRLEEFGDEEEQGWAKEVRSLLSRMSKGDTDIEFELESSTEKGTDMTIEELQKKLDAATKRAEKAEEALKAKDYEMDEDEMAAAEAMDEKAKKSFTAMTKSERKAHLAEIAKSDEVLKIDGVGEIRKSIVGATQFSVFKAQQTRIEKAEAEAARQADLAKRADIRKSIETGVLKNLPGETEAVVDAMKAIGGLDETVSKTITTMLEAGAKAIGAAFTTIGHQGGNGKTAKAAGEGFLKKVEEIKSAEKCSHQDAMVKARRDHPDLFKAYQGGDTSN